MKFTPELRPLTMTGVASLAGLAVFMMVFFFTATLITGPGTAPVPLSVSAAPAAAVPGVTASVPDSLVTAPVGPARPGSPLLESVRASLLAAAGAAEYSRGGQYSTRPAMRPRPDPRVRTAPPRATGAAKPAGTPRSVAPHKVTGTVVMGSIQWIGGGRRKKAAGVLPAFPPGVSTDAQIKVEAVVAPDGRVRSVRPGQKGNAKCEGAAIRAVQRWRFDRLPRGVPQRDQRCVVSFTFNVK